MAVKTQQITQQLTREIKRNPAKAAVLGGLLVIAVWFWFPLIQGWFGSSESFASSDGNTSIVVNQSNRQSSPASATKTPSHSDWQAIAQQIDDDPRMKPGTLRTDTFDPFFPEQPLETQLTATEAEPEASSVPDVSPETAGLAVTSVIVGGRQPIARINKLNYHVGDQIAVDGGQITFTLMAVKNWGVILQNQQRSYELHLEHAPLPTGHRMVMRNGTVISPDN